MGIFGAFRNIVSSRSDESGLWNQPQTVDQINEILERTQKPQVIYKHSYSCAVSLFAKSSLESDLETIAKKADLHLVDVIAQRPLASKISDKTGIRHESPQVILMYKGDPFWHDSHGGVRIKSLVEALNELTRSSNE